MYTHEIKAGIYYVGMLNPNLRVFDIIMKTEYGTSYNSYLVCGKDKTALIETTHLSFFDDYLESVKKVIDPSKIDYIVLNHTEPDHSGSLRRLLEINPDITVVSSIAGNKYATKIANRTFNSIIAKDNLELDLGGKTLRFINAPLLHWPDSMFTYCVEDKVLFPCDFLGAHFCEPLLFDTKILYKDRYEDAFLNYYAAIFSPFKEAVLSGLDKIKDLEIDIICPSHGPLLTEQIESAKKKYYDWSIDIRDKNIKKKVLILYVSAYGCTKSIAAAIKEELTNDFDVELFDVIEQDLAVFKEKIDKCDGLLLGTPTINRDALKPIWDITTMIDAIVNKGKYAGVFGSFGWSGEGVPMIVERLRGLKLNVVGDGLKINFVPSPEDLASAKEYAAEFGAKLI